MIQLLRGVKHLHDNWILHRDLKTSNLLLSHSGILKVRITLNIPHLWKSLYCRITLHYSYVKGWIECCALIFKRYEMWLVKHTVLKEWTLLLKRLPCHSCKICVRTWQNKHGLVNTEFFIAWLEAWTLFSSWWCSIPYAWQCHLLFLYQQCSVWTRIALSTWEIVRLNKEYKSL